MRYTFNKYLFESTLEVHWVKTVALNVVLKIIIFNITLFHEILDIENLLGVEDTGIFRGVQTNYFHISFPFGGGDWLPQICHAIVLSVQTAPHFKGTPFSSLSVWASTSSASVPTMPTLSPASSPPCPLPVNSLFTSHLIALHSWLQKSSGPNAFML